MGILDMNFFSFIGFKKKPNARWAKYYSKKEMNLDVPNMSIYQQLKQRSLDGNYKEMYISYNEDDLLIIQVGNSDEGPRYIAYK